MGLRVPVAVVALSAVAFTLAPLGCADPNYSRGPASEVEVDAGPASPAPLSVAHCSFQTPTATAGSGSAVTEGDVFAGTAEVILDVPIGAALGAYAARANIGAAEPTDGRASPIAGRFQPSIGVESAPRAKVIALKVGTEELILVKLDLGVAPDGLTYEIAAALGDAYAGKVLVATGHSHSSWGHLIPNPVLDIGFGVFHRDLYERVRDQIIAAARSAIAARVPAKIAVHHDGNFDPTDKVSRDRRNANDAPELPAVEAAIRRCARAGVDALIVQDMGVARLAKAIAPAMPLHASTQMTCTDAAAAELAKDLGADRVILARELSVSEVASIAKDTRVELEVFVHGALCIAYSGQCLTSEAIGGRSANRGACAQACRLPYDLVVDGELRSTGDRAFLLSPEDLEASSLVPSLAQAGVVSLKIEGRLKGPAYVAATTRLYREAVKALAGTSQGPTEEQRHDAIQTFSRGSGPGFLQGIDHQRLVEGRGSDHRGTLLGELVAVHEGRSKKWLRVKLAECIFRGDGILVEGGRANEGEVGGYVWAIAQGHRDLDEGVAGSIVELWLGPDKAIDDATPGRRVFKSGDPVAEKRVLASLASQSEKRALHMHLTAKVGEVPRLTGTTESGRFFAVEGTEIIAASQKVGAAKAVALEKLSRLGDTPFAEGRVDLEVDPHAFLPPSLLNRLRRELVEGVLSGANSAWPCSEATALDVALQCGPLPAHAPAPGIFVLCRSLDQARAARAAGADGVWLDFLELQGLGAAFRALRAEGPGFLGVAPPRIRKPGEEKIDRYLEGLFPDAILVRGLGALHEATGRKDSIARVGDFSLNVTNELSARELLRRGLVAFTPSFDLDSEQLGTLLATEVGPFAELVVHHPMPLFHMEHCVIAAELSTGHDHRDCGRPCDRHKVSLRDRAGMDHPVEADIGCRNTVFHAASQSAAGLVAVATKRGVSRFRIELVREDAANTARIVESYRSLVAGTMSPADLWTKLQTEGHYGVVRGSLRVL